MLDLTWNSAKERILEEVCNSDAQFGEGYASIFVPLNEHCGVKLFPKHKWRDFAVEKQRAVASYALGPAVGDVFEVPESLRNHARLQWEGYGEKDSHCFGYVTQRADTSRSPTEDEMKVVIADLISKPDLKAPPADDFEDNPANFGYLDGRLVFLDFDQGTWSTAG